MFIHFDTTINRTGTNTFDCMLKTDIVYKNISKIFLKSVEIPVAFYQTHAPLNKFTMNSVSYTIPESDYTISSMINACNMVFTDGIFILGSNNLVTFSSSNVYTMSVVTGDVLYQLGFRDSQSGTVIQAQCGFNMNIHTYVSMAIKNISTSSPECRFATFKIPVDVKNGIIFYQNENQQFTQCIEMNNTTFIDRLIISVYDRFGNILNNNGVDWSFTLMLI